MTGLEGKPAIDATNAFAGRDEKYESLAHEVRAHTKGPVERLQHQLRFALRPYRLRTCPTELPLCGYAADDEALDVVEELIWDAGYEPVRVGGLESARAVDDFVPDLLMKVAPSFYRFAAPHRAAGRSLG